MTYPVRLADRYTGLGAQTLAPQKSTFQIFFFSVTIHLIIFKWLKRQKCRQKRKIMRQKDVEAKEEIVYESVFINLNTQ